MKSKFASSKPQYKQTQILSTYLFSSVVFIRTKNSYPLKKIGKNENEMKKEIPQKIRTEKENYENRSVRSARRLRISGSANQYSDPLS